MAHSQDSTTSSGYWSSRGSTATTRNTLNPHYLCFWLDTCKGQHELVECRYWKRHLKGKLGIYYAPSGDYRTFTRDSINNKDLSNNPTGCADVHLLVFNDEKKQVLFGLKMCKENRNSQQRRLLLTFPSAYPYQQNGRMLNVPFRAFQWLTTDNEFAKQCLEQGLRNRFLFQNANVIYPVHLTNDQALKLTRDFRPNEEFRSLHWFPLSEVLLKLPKWPNYISPAEITNELAQTSREYLGGITLGEYELWILAVRCLICIREYVGGGLDTFLEI